ncbi:MAG: Tic20 family protein [Cyanobacteria bacterium J06642_2]
MVWRGSTSTGERLLAALPYLFPLSEAFGFASTAIFRLPLLQLLLSPLTLLLRFFRPVLGLPSLLVFFVLLLAVVRNPRVPRFIRYNTAMALITDIALTLAAITFQLILRLFGNIDSIRFVIGETLFPLVGLAAIAVCVYAFVQVARGRYTEVPGISTTAYAMTSDGY